MPFPKENTPRLIVDYNDGIHDHLMTWRYSDFGSSTTEAMDAVKAFLATLDSSWYLITILGARLIPEGTNVSHPIAWTGDATYGSGSMPAVNAPRETRWEARGLDGSKTDISLYGGNYSTPATYRLLTSDATWIANSVAALETAATDLDWTTIGGVGGFVKPYVNINFNSYWERQARP